MANVVRVRMDLPGALPVPSLSANEAALAVPVRRERTTRAIHTLDIATAF